MRIFFAYILTCFALIFSSITLSKPVINKLEKSHDYRSSKQITIKFEEEVQPNYENTKQNVEYINTKLKNSGNFNYKISFTENGVINLLFIENEKKFSQAQDFLTKKSFELCFLHDKDEQCQVINTNNNWSTKIEKNNNNIDNSARLIISVPEDEANNVNSIYQKNLQFLNQEIDKIKKGIWKDSTHEFYIKTKFENGKVYKKQLEFHNFYPDKNQSNKFQINFPDNGKENIDDIYFYEKLWNTAHEKRNYKIISDDNIYSPINELNFSFKTFITLFTSFVFIFLLLIVFYHFHSIATIAVIFLQTFLIILGFIFTKQIFNFKAFIGLIITIFTTLMISVIYGNTFFKEIENGNHKNIALENVNKKINAIINGISVIYMILGFAIYLIEPQNINNFGIVTIFILNAIIGFIVNKLVFKKLIYLINQSIFANKHYEIFSEVKNTENNLLKKIESKKFSPKKEKIILIVFLISFLTGLTLVINFKTFFKKSMFENQNFKNNIRISFVKNGQFSVPYLLQEFEQIKQIKYNSNVKEYDDYIKEKDKTIKRHNFIIDVENDISENKEIKNKLDELSKKINANITIEKEYLYNDEISLIKILSIPLITTGLFCFYLFISRKYYFSQIINTFFITSINSIIPLLFISLTRVFVEPYLIVTSIIITTLFSLITCFYIMLKNRNLIHSKSSDSYLNNLLISVSESWKLIGISLIIINALFLPLSFINKLTIILFASLVGFLITIFVIKHFFVLISNQIDEINTFLFSKNQKEHSNLIKKNNSINSQNKINEEIFTGIND